MSGKSSRKKYQELILGQGGWFRLLKYELITGFAGWMPGAAGLFLRSRLYPLLLAHTGKNVYFGRGVVLRHPSKISVGDDTVIDDLCVLDAKGESNKGILIGRGVFLGRNTILNCKNGDIVLKDEVNIGFNAHIFSASEVVVEEKNLIAAYAYLVGGTHHFEDPLKPVLDQGRSSKGISVGPGGWIGAHVTVFDGVRIGKHAVIAAGSMVHRNIPDYAVAGGNPVTIINRRKPEKKQEEEPDAG
jgi:acetyltransferase-like isoleucine patch superfamily enzyme